MLVEQSNLGSQLVHSPRVHNLPDGVTRHLRQRPPASVDQVHLRDWIAAKYGTIAGEGDLLATR